MKTDFEYPQLINGVECKFADGSKVLIGSIICPADRNKILAFSYGVSFYDQNDFPQNEFVEFDLRKITALEGIATLFWRCQSDVKRLESLSEMISSTYLTASLFASVVQNQRDFR